MVIDASIPLGIKPFQIMSPNEAQAQNLSLRDLQAQTQLRQQQVQQGEQTLRDQQELAGVAADRANIDPKTGGLTPEALAKLSNPALRQKLNQDRMSMMLKTREIEHKESENGKIADERKSKALNEIFEQADSTYADVFKKTQDVKLATEASEKVQREGFDELKRTGKGGFSSETQFNVLAPDDIARKLISHKERKALEHQERVEANSALTPFLKETAHLRKLKGQLADLSSGDPAAATLQQQISDVTRHIAKLDAPTATEIKIQQGAADAKEAAKTANMAGEELMKALPPKKAATVKAIIEGRMTLASLGIRGKDREEMAALVNQIDPGYDEANAKARYGAMNKFLSGKESGTVRSLNVSIDHLDTLQKTADALHNGDIRFFNKMGNEIAAMTGKVAPTDFNATKKIVADEVSKAIIGGATALGDREETAKAINAANSPAQLAGVINRYKELMAGQMNGLRQQYVAATKRTDFDDRFLLKETREQLDRKDGKASTVPNPMQSLLTATNPTTGEKLVLKDGKWQPMK